MNEAQNKILGVQDLSALGDKGQHAISNVSFELVTGQCIAIMGKSGSGKTLLCRSLLGMLPDFFSISGSILFQGKEIANAHEATLTAIRGKYISMIMQDPSNAFFPLFTIGTQMEKILRSHTNLSASQAKEFLYLNLNKLSMPDPASTLKKYPYQLSRGMLQRCMIGLNLSLSPRAIIADEPTTALDPFSQSDAINQLKILKNETGASLILVSHSLNLIKDLASYILVMENGYVVEQGSVESIFTHPQNAYTKQFIDAQYALEQGRL